MTLLVQVLLAHGRPPPTLRHAPTVTLEPTHLSLLPHLRPPVLPAGPELTPLSRLLRATTATPDLTRRSHRRHLWPRAPAVLPERTRLSLERPQRRPALNALLEHTRRMLVLRPPLHARHALPEATTPSLELTRTMTAPPVEPASGLLLLAPLISAFARTVLRARTLRILLPRVWPPAPLAVRVFGRLVVLPLAPTVNLAPGQARRV